MDSAQVKRFRISQIEIGRCDQGDEEIGHERLSRSGASLVGTLSDGAEEREHGVGDAAQDGDDESRTRAGFDPRVIVFLESVVEDLMRRLDAPVTSSDKQPMVSSEADAGCEPNTPPRRK